MRRCITQTFDRGLRTGLNIQGQKKRGQFSANVAPGTTFVFSAA